MENRFGVKDLVLSVLLVGVIIILLLGMKQYDRQYQVMTELDAKLDRQAGVLSELTRTLQRGVAFSGTQAVPGSASPVNQEQSPKGDPFRNIRAVESSPDFARGDWLIENYGVKFNRLTPLGTTGDLYGTMVRARVQESLIYRDPVTLDYLPLLALDWTIKDNSEEWNAYVKPFKDKGLQQDQIVEELDKDPKAPSAIEITYKLRTGVLFTDGKPFTADDVVFTFNWIMNPAVEAPRERAFVKTNIKDVVKVNDHEVVFKLKQPYFEALELTGTLDVYPKHFYEAVGPQKFNQTPGLLLGTGPYMLPNPSTWTPGTALELIRNNRYWGVPPTFDKIKYREVEGESAEMGEFRNGGVDRLACQPDQYKELLKDEALLARSQHFELDAPDSGYTFIAWNQRRDNKPTPFADPRVRKAMTLLIDRQRMAEELMLGYANVATGPFTPLGRQANPNIKAWPYDVRQAIQLLKDAGFEDRNKDGVVESKEGTPLRFKLTYNAKNQLSERIGLFVKDSLVRAKVAMELEPTDWTIMLKNMDSRSFDAITLGWSGGIETDIFQMFHSSQTKDAGDNFMHYVNPELDKLVEQARSTVDEQKRLPLWHRAHEILHEEQPYTFLFDRKILVFIDKRIANVGPSKLGLNYAQRYVQPIPWYVPLAQQKWGK